MSCEQVEGSIVNFAVNSRNLNTTKTSKTVIESVNPLTTKICTKQKIEDLSNELLILLGSSIKQILIKHRSGCDQSDQSI